jgi:Skp family chaperone for outer membrane proteins
MSGVWLQLFLGVNVFAIGALTVIAYQHARAHFRPHEADKPKEPKPTVQLSPAAKEKLLLAAEANFQKMLNHSAEELQRDLKATTTQMNSSLQKLGGDIINEEMARYKKSLDELRAQTEITIGGAQKQVETHQADLEVKFAERQAELEKKLQEEIEAERQRLITQIDTKLADAVASFLIETMQHEVDLGAQTAYLTKMLEAHKDDFKQGVVSETGPTK